MTRTDLPSGTVTFLFTDIEGSTRLVAELDVSTYRDLLERHHASLRAAFGRHGAVERGTQGDAFLVVFDDAPAAVAAAVDAQRSLAATEWPGGARVRVRMGIHTGRGLLGGDDYVGIDINRAARIASAAHGGQVLVSDAARALVERSLRDGIALRDLGEHRLKDLSRPERLFQVLASGLPADFPPPRAVQTPAGDLPVRLTSFVGRRSELDELAAILAETRLVTLTGPGGAGKTSLAVELARETVGRFPDGAWFVPLEGVSDAELVAPAIATTFGLVESGGSARERVSAFISDRSLLLILDNFEQVRPAAPLVMDLLQGAPGVRILVTSRAPLRLSAEQEFTVMPLPVPDAGDGAASSDCVRLFVDRARRVQRGFEVSDENVAAIARICRRLDGLPLGIELAAGRVGLLPPATIAERIASRLDLPGAGPRDLPERQRTLHAAIAWSHDLLGDDSRRLFARLAVFAGGCRLEEAEVVCGADPDGGDVLEGLSALVEQSLVQSSVGPDGPRFGVLEPVRVFAAERLAEAGETEILRRRHALAYLGLAEASRAFVPGRHQVAWLASLAADHDNLRSALRWAIDAGEAEVALRLTAALWRYWQLAGHLEEAAAVADEVLAMSGAEAPTRWRLGALDAAGGIFYWRADHARAGELYREQLEVAEAIGDRRAIADAMFNLAFPVGLWDGFEAAEALTTEAARIYADLGDEAALARTEWSLASVVQFMGRTEVSLPMLEASLEHFRELDDLPYVGLVLGSISWAHMRLGSLEAALTAGVRSILASHTLGDRATTTLTLQGAALLVGMLGLVKEGATIVGAFDALSRRYGVRPPMAFEKLFSWDEATRMASLLRSEAHAEARAEGARMSLDEAVDYVARLAREWADRSDGPAVNLS